METRKEYALFGPSGTWLQPADDNNADCEEVHTVTKNPTEELSTSTVHPLQHRQQQQEPACSTAILQFFLLLYTIFYILCKQLINDITAIYSMFFSYQRSGDIAW